jgi:hypothetical protein
MDPYYAEEKRAEAVGRMASEKARAMFLASDECPAHRRAAEVMAIIAKKKSQIEALAAEIEKLKGELPGL